MSNTVLLKDIADIITGPFGSQLHESDYVPEGIPSIMPQNIGNRILNYDGIARITEKDAKRLSRYLVKENDIVYARRGDVEKHAFISAQDEGALCGTGCLRVRIISDAVYPTYLSHFLNRPETRRWITLHAVGSNMPNINTDILGAVPIELPAYETQKAIADMLSDFDKKINLNTRLCAELEAMAKTLYDYWFVQFDFPDENGKPYRTSGGEMEYCPVLGREIPKGWKIGKYSDLIESVRTGLNPRQNFTFSQGNIRYLTVKNLTLNGSIDFSGCDTIDEAARKIVHRRSDISVGDVLFASIAPLGRCYLIQSVPSDWDINESVFSLRPNYKNCTSDYLYLTLKSNHFIAGSTNSSTGSIFKGIRINTLMDMATLIPSFAILEFFSIKVKSILHKMEALFSENEQLIHLRDWLLPMLMNGQVKVFR